MRKTLLWALAAMGAAISGSCVSYDVARRAEYIGPMQPCGRLPAPAATMPASAPAATQEQGGPLVLDIQEAIVLALSNNRALAVQRLGPDIRRTFVLQELGVFDPVARAVLAGQSTRSEKPDKTSESNSLDAAGSIEAFFPTGTTVALEADGSHLDSLYSDDLASSRVGLSVTQALLEGAGVRVNLASLHQARLDVLSSQYELRGFAESLVAQVEITYWDYALAAKQIEIFTDSLKLAQQQLHETQQRIEVGTLAETELAAAQAEVALRRENLINARSRLQQRQLRLIRLLNPAEKDGYGRPIVLLDRPAVPQTQLDDIDKHVQVAMLMRPELNQARLLIDRGELEIVRTRNGLLPRLDLFVNLGKSGFAETFGQSVEALDGGSYDVAAGLRFSQPIGDRQARARYSRSVLGRDAAVLALFNLEQLVEEDVRAAFIEINRAREQIDATATTRKFQEESLRAETEKLRVGKSTSFLVARAQRDLLASQIAEIEAVARYVQALVELYRLEGSLLERRGIAAPGREPVKTIGTSCLAVHAQ